MISAFCFAVINVHVQSHVMTSQLHAEKPVVGQPTTAVLDPATSVNHNSLERRDFGVISGPLAITLLACFVIAVSSHLLWRMDTT